MRHSLLRPISVRRNSREIKTPQHTGDSGGEYRPCDGAIRDRAGFPRESSSLTPQWMVCTIFGKYNRNRRADFNPRIFDSGLVEHLDSRHLRARTSRERRLPIAVCGDELEADSDMAARGAKLRKRCMAQRQPVQRALVVSEP